MSMEEILKEKVLGSVDLYKMWMKLFENYESTPCTSKEIITETHIRLLFGDVTQKYLKMSISQLRRDYLHEQKVKKAEATSKQIKMRSKHCTKAFNFSTIENDSTSDKTASHKRLQSEIISDANFLQQFTKKELDKLCQYYKHPNMQSKKELVLKLGEFTETRSCNSARGHKATQRKKHKKATKSTKDEEG
jgi:hypothetical protein